MNINFSSIVFLITSVLTLQSVSTNVIGAEKKIFEARYSSEYSGVELEIARTLKRLENHQYVFEMEGNGSFARVNEKSLFTLSDQRLVPLDYVYKRKVFGLGKKEHVAFNWGKNEAYYRKGKSKPVTHALSPGILDASLYQLKLQMDLSSGQKDLQYQYVQKDKIRTREFVITGDESFQLKGKNYEAKVIQRVSDDNRKHTEIWVLPDLYYQIAYIKQVKKDGETLETRLQSFNYDKTLLTNLYGSR